MTDSCDPARRRWLGQLLASGVLGVVGVRLAQAGSTPVVQPGINTLQGDVSINGSPATEGAVVDLGDTIETGPDSHSVVVVGQSAYLLRANTQLQLHAVSGAHPTVDLKRGRLLSVFEPGARRLLTPTAIVGVRGTGVYLEAGEQQTYVCLCYGEAELMARDNPQMRELISTRHHESPRLIRSGSSDWTGEKMAVKNHSDDELIMLESLVGRAPPFLDEWLSGDYGG